MRSGFLALCVVWAIVAAGCASPAAQKASTHPLGGSTGAFAEDYALGNGTVPPQELQDATLGTEHVHDLWQGKEELVLLDNTSDAGLCEGPIDAAAYAFVMASSHQEAAFGCVRVSIPEGSVVPEGTGDLSIEVDASQSLKSGSIALQWRDKAREVEEAPTTEAKHAWNVALTAADWDLPHANATTFVIYVASRGPAGAFDGPVTLRVVAHKIPGWQPVLAVAHVDHWKLPHLHRFAAPGVMRLYDGPGEVSNVDPQRVIGGKGPEPIALDDIVAPGTTAITIVVDDVSTGCPAVIHCWIVPALNVGGYSRQAFGETVFEQGPRHVYRWAVPGVAPADSVYANKSTTTIETRINACGPDGGASCGLASLASSDAKARLLVLAWHGDVDLELLQRIADAGSKAP